MPAPSQPMQQSNRREKHQSVPIFHNPHQFVKDFSNLSIPEKSPIQHLRESFVNNNSKSYDVSLLGTPPLIEDFQLPFSKPNIPSSVNTFLVSYEENKT
jgi:hypothetical protein